MRKFMFKLLVKMTCINHGCSNLSPSAWKIIESIHQSPVLWCEVKVEVTNIVEQAKRTHTIEMYKYRNNGAYMFMLKRCEDSLRVAIFPTNENLDQTSIDNNEYWNILSTAEQHVIHECFTKMLFIRRMKEKREKSQQGTKTLKQIVNEGWY